MPTSTRRQIFVVLIGLTLVSPISAAELRGRGEPLAERRLIALDDMPLFGHLWKAVARLWSEAGGNADPNGADPSTGSSQTKCEAGGSLDPNGLCRP